jgi:LAO/AO transport system kinase
MKTPDVKALFAELQTGNRAALARAITLVESRAQQHQAAAGELLAYCLPQSGRSLRIGITGVPGVGKSTFIDTFGSLLTAADHKVAVLAIDPSSGRSGGSILGDKTRMEQLSQDLNAFIRPTAAGSTLGGVARNSWEAMILCEAAGYDIVLIETVGVGQSETAVYGMVDFFLLLMLAGAGDELQGIKRGIMELADLLVINKAEGENMLKAKLAASDYRNALHLFPAHPGQWTPEVLLASALNNEGIAEVWKSICRYADLVKPNGYFVQRRQEQAVLQFREHIHYQLDLARSAHPDLLALYQQLEKAVAQGERNPFDAALEFAGRLLR